MTDENANNIIRKENRHGVMKDYVEVSIGTAVHEVPRYIRNPMTDRRHDLTKLSDDGYLKPFLALYHVQNRSDVVHLRSAPVLSFWKRRWRQVESENHVILIKREPESALGKTIVDRLEAGRDLEVDFDA